jgi:hypothetical protein
MIILQPIINYKGLLAFANLQKLTARCAFTSSHFESPQRGSRARSPHPPAAAPTLSYFS